MQWLYKSLMAASVIGGSLVTAGLLPIAFAGVFAATAAGAGYLHDSPRR